MTWRPQYRSSKFRHVFGKVASKDHSYDGVPITRSVHDNHLCAVNPLFIAVITECAGGGAFLVLPINHTGKVDPHYPRISGHKGNVLDIKWNPFNDFCIASCSEDTTVKVWDISKHGVLRNITVPSKDLQGHSRRVGLIEWHPTANDILFSTGYDYQVMVWNLNSPEQVIKNPVRSISIHKDVVLSMSFNTEGSLIATSCKDKKVRVIDPRAGTLLQETTSKTYKISKVVFLGNLKMLLSTGTSSWNHRQIALWDQEDLSQPSYVEDLDGSSGVLFPFYDPDTHMLYIAGKGDGNIRIYEISTEKPFVHYLNEYRSLLPQKGLGLMPKRGLDVCSCEIYRFYRLVTTKNLIEPLSMIVPRRSESYQEDIYPMTAGNKPSMTAEAWLGGMNKDPVLVSLKPGSSADVTLNKKHEEPDNGRSQNEPASQRTFTEKHDIKKDDRKEQNFTDTIANGQSGITICSLPKTGNEHQINKDGKLQEIKKDDRKEKNFTVSIAKGQPDITICSPPKTENELLQVYYKQQEEIRRLRELLAQRDVQIKQLELEIKNVRNAI